MYADDTVLFATSKGDLQKSLNVYAEYCKKWKLKLNVDKTKIVCFGMTRHLEFTLDNKLIETVPTFKYLGVTLSRNGRFINAMKNNIEKAIKGMHSLRRTFYEKHIPLDCQLDLLEKTIEPILLYGAEIWGFENTEIIEKCRLKILKHLLNVKQSTPAYMVYGETGTLPLKVTIKKRMVMFWHRIITGKADKLSSQLYQIMLNDSRHLNIEYKWLASIENILNETGHGFMWLNQTSHQCNTAAIKQSLHDQAVQNIHTESKKSNKGTFYINMKNEWNNEFYIKSLDGQKVRMLTKFRTANHRFPIETGRYNNTPRVERKCSFCLDQIGDEFHYLLECPHFNRQRKKYISKTYRQRPNMFKFISLMQSKNIKELSDVATFVGLLFKSFK